MINKQSQPEQPPSRDCASSPQACDARPAWRSEELLGDRTEVLIFHNDNVYRLRRTRQGKLILHK